MLISNCQICKAENFASEFQKSINKVKERKKELDSDIRMLQEVAKDFKSFALSDFPASPFSTAKKKLGTTYGGVILQLNKKNLYHCVFGHIKVHHFEMLKS